jgi:NAD(P)-dependent dehydrogenase (short-subunit alcohol dehydrogenase family)
MQLKDKTIIITGASSGIGEAAAYLFAAEGAKLVLGARRPEELRRVENQIKEKGGRAISVVGDVCDESFSERLVTAAEDTFGRLHAGFNNAGVMGDMIPVPDMPSENWLSVIETNLTSAFYAAKHQIPAFKRAGGGSIVFTSSFVGYTASLPGMGAYAAAKAGLVGLVQTLATEHGADGVRANALLPGGTKTAMAGDLNDPDHLGFLNSLHALKRLADPNEIARAAVFLTSDASSFVTGTALIADGGNSINKV